MTIILGAGLAGLSTSHHLGNKCVLFEKQVHAGGHIYSHESGGFTWDEGPHISFTKNDYVKEFLEKAIGGDFLEYEVNLSNYFRGHWIPHPAQTNLYAVPEPERTACLQSFISSRSETDTGRIPQNYDEWLLTAFGKTFAETFPAAYTRKYWTTEPGNLTADWVGNRLYFPDVEEVRAGFEKPPAVSRNYITTARYPKKGGFVAYAKKMIEGATIHYKKEVVRVELDQKKVLFSDGTSEKYTRLVNTIALPEFVLKTDPPEAVRAAVSALSCSELLLFNVIANHPPKRKNNWIYVYDEDKYATRINFTDLFSAENGQPGKCGIQVEVYFSKYRPQTESENVIREAVCNELVEMGLVESLTAIEHVSTITTRYANVIFDHPRRKALDTIYTYLEKFGLKREKDDLEAGTSWNQKLSGREQLGELVMAGRYGQWKYYWTDDCVLRGLWISRNL